MPSSREDAIELLHEWTQSESLRRHAVAVEAVMRAYASLYEEDPELWGLTGLLHDFDYERHPDLERHPVAGSKTLREKGYPEEVIEAILGHATYTGVPRRSRMAKALFATDELCGLITAVTLVRPSKKLADVKVKSVKKKIKDKAFARSVNRDDIRQGVEELGVTLDDHIAFCLEALKPIAANLGL